MFAFKKIKTLLTACKTKVPTEEAEHGIFRARELKEFRLHFVSFPSAQSPLSFSEIWQRHSDLSHIMHPYYQICSLIMGGYIKQK